MAECYNCISNPPLYACINCKILMCEDDREMHAKRRPDHDFERAKIKLVHDELVKIVENLSLKIKKADECQEKIIQETEALIEKIQSMRRDALEIIKRIQKNYIKLLEMSQQALLPEQTAEIRLEMKKQIKLEVPSLEFSKIEDFYRLNFIAEPIIEKYRQATPRLSEKEEKIKKLAEERLKRLEKEKIKSANILEQTEQLEKELVELRMQMEGKIRKAIPKGVIKDKDFDNILNNGPYVSVANSVEDEIKTLYAGVSKRIDDLKAINTQLRKVITYTAADIILDNELNDIIKLNNDQIDTSIPQSSIDRESCKSFVDFMTKLVIWALVEKKWPLKSIKVSNNREFYFFCKFYPDCKGYADKDVLGIY